MLGRDERNKKAAMEALKAYPGGMQVGGGINPSNAKEYLKCARSRHRNFLRIQRRSH